MSLRFAVRKLDRYFDGWLKPVCNPRMRIPLRDVIEEFDEEIDRRTRTFAQERHHRCSIRAWREIMVSDTASQFAVQLSVYRIRPLEFLLKITILADYMASQARNERGAQIPCCRQTFIEGPAKQHLLKL